MSAKIDPLQLAFDVGHSSIGWAVIQPSGPAVDDLQLLGCGVVTFRADDCLASARRGYRRQRRHIRATRSRVDRLKKLLRHLGALTQKELDTPGCAWPWLLAARVLAQRGGPAFTPLSWPEMWDVIRWYAHNRGYNGNIDWAKSGAEPAPRGGDEDAEDDAEKVVNARELMRSMATHSMAATVCAVSGLDPLGKKRSANVPPAERFKARNAAFPREVVTAEVRQILEAHASILPGITPEFIRALMEDWKALPCPEIKLPRRFSGGLLFGQLIPRFDNRVISRCPISGGKVPTRNAPEFLKFRWAMLLANIRVASNAEPTLRPLSIPERHQLDELMRAQGSLTPTDLKKAVREIAGSLRDNLETMFMHPDSKDALVLDPIQKRLAGWDYAEIFQALPEQVRSHARIRLSRRKSFTLQQGLVEAARLGLDTTPFERALAGHLEKRNVNRKKKETPPTRAEILANAIEVKPLAQRAAYSRALLAQAHADVMAGKHPKEPGGCLFVTDEMRDRQLNRPIDDQTNNHLVRHRLLILNRLVEDIVKGYANGDHARVQRATIEVNRDLREMSGKTAKEKAQDLGLRLSNHAHVSKELEKHFTPEQITAGLIRKARVATDLGWRCPFTGKQYDPMQLFHKGVDKDHIIPYSLRPSNSLESLVITFSEVNRLKGKRTALQFVEEFGGKPVPGMPSLSIHTPEQFKRFVEGLESFKGHPDDKRRKKKRKELLLLRDYEEKEFVPRDLTQTSQLVRLGAQSIKRAFQHVDRTPVVVSLPGSVTGLVRKSWRLLGSLAQANPQVLDPDGETKTKTEIRDVTHLHHALDACVLGFAAQLIPNNGRVWELLLKRKHNPAERAEMEHLGLPGAFTQFGFELTDLPSNLKGQIASRLQEKRVVQHIPSRMDGLRVEQNTWRVLETKEDEVILQQSMRGPDQIRVEKRSSEKPLKLLGLNPDTRHPKLKKLKGVLVIPDNFGVALDPEPTIIPYHKVQRRLAALAAKNGGKMPRVIRNGQLIHVNTGRFIGIWRVFSVKNTAVGIMLDLGHPDIVRMQSKGEGIKRQVRLQTLISDGLKGTTADLIGLNSCPTTSSTSTPPSAP